MISPVIYLRNRFFGLGYRYILKPIFFLFDPEKVHDFMTLTGRLLGRFTLTRFLVELCFGYKNARLRQTIAGISFPNPIGLSAGFDKDAHLVNILPAVGFGFAELGSVTGEASVGNPKPRLWRLPKSKSLVVYYGLKNDGAEKISSRLRKIFSHRPMKIPFGISVAMTNCQKNLDTESAINDYAKAFGSFVDIGSYITVNISCPNALGGQPFSVPDNFDLLFSKLDTVACDRPIFIKMSPDLTRENIDQIIELASRHRIDGFICTNLTKNRQNEKIIDDNLPEKGGISGKVVDDLANELIHYLYKKAGDKFIIIGCGGIFNAHDAYKKIRLGASLCQLITGMIYEGPQVISEINRGLVELLERDGFTTIKDAIGVDSL